jgi:hypothetical protein
VQAGQDIRLFGSYPIPVLGLRIPNAQVSGQLLVNKQAAADLSRLFGNQSSPIERVQVKMWPV